MPSLSESVEEGVTGRLTRSVWVDVVYSPQSAIISPSVFVVDTSNVIVYVPSVAFTSPVIELAELAPRG